MYFHREIFTKCAICFLLSKCKFSFENWQGAKCSNKVGITLIFSISWKTTPYDTLCLGVSRDFSSNLIYLCHDFIDWGDEFRFWVWLGENVCKIKMIRLNVSLWRLLCWQHHSLTHTAAWWKCFLFGFLAKDTMTLLISADWSFLAQCYSLETCCWWKSVHFLHSSLCRCFE